MYRHTQVGWIVLGVCGVLAVVLAWQLPRAPGAPLPLVALPQLVLLAVAVLFAALTVQVDEREIELSFGPGLIRKRIALADVTECRAVRNPALAGWGIRWLGHGWLYNVSGLDAVELSMRNGSVLRIGTDEPDRLEAAISARLAH